MINLTEQVLAITQASAITATEVVQSLWSGYGQIKRCHLKGGKYPSVIVKHIQGPNKSHHPRGWNTTISDERKRKSYQVEQHWYETLAKQTNKHCRVPNILKSVELDSEILLIMEDLDASGYRIRLQHGGVSLNQVKACLSWLAQFHAQFMQTEGEGLWPIGTYWHLDTRPDEWNRMTNNKLKKAAKAIDGQLNSARFQTLVHGDAKLANFCFKSSGEVAAVDFQYVGRGCGIKDVAYFISSCLDDEECGKHEEELLKHYFKTLQQALNNDAVFQEVKKEWAELYAYAWADFYRFLDGWGPGHWKMHGYSEQLTQRVLDELKERKK
ncbi:oxidoreductase family protein [Marinoscillum sp. MHG1-6]|uniref:oxidoreductase family protein n=1 Tax=Marinoscillum sp. MHG1-6 TaxID=2959627 RepID=UPI002157C09A|nr:oxidoreductase family protein [Marinoscillum sp. MHG1-6]